MRTLLLAFSAIYLVLSIYAIYKSSKPERKPDDTPCTWAIIGREYVEFTPEEMEWRYGK